MPTITIDGRRRKVKDGITILEAAREMGIPIPTLCFHEALSPAGACRICVVEVTSSGRTKVMASCVTPVEEGMSIKTSTERILNIRRTLLELLLARCPEVGVIKRMAKAAGLDESSFLLENEDCFLCGLCVRACEEIVGMNAIGFANRGIEQEVAPPFLEAASTCISCGTCTTVCPAQTFKVSKVDRAVSVHTFAQKMLARVCSVCENHYATSE